MAPKNMGEKYFQEFGPRIFMGAKYFQEFGQKYMPVLCQEYMLFFCLPLSSQPRLNLLSTQQQEPWLTSQWQTEK